LFVGLLSCHVMPVMIAAVLQRSKMQTSRVEAHLCGGQGRHIRLPPPTHGRLAGREWDDELQSGMGV
jgi:hypothetical protein